jgi:hypothetical protein
MNRQDAKKRKRANNERQRITENLPDSSLSLLFFLGDFGVLAVHLDSASKDSIQLLTFILVRA